MIVTNSALRFAYGSADSFFGRMIGLVETEFGFHCLLREYETLLLINRKRRFSYSYAKLKHIFLVNDYDLHTNSLVSKQISQAYEPHDLILVQCLLPL
jgi:hypothetical protein